MGGVSENLSVLIIKVWTAIVSVVFVEIRSSFSISIPLKKISSCFGLVKLLKFGI